MEGDGKISILNLTVSHLVVVGHLKSEVTYLLVVSFGKGELVKGVEFGEGWA